MGAEDDRGRVPPALSHLVFRTGWFAVTIRKFSIVNIAQRC